MLPLVLEGTLKLRPRTALYKDWPTRAPTTCTGTAPSRQELGAGGRAHCPGTPLPSAPLLVSPLQEELARAFNYRATLCSETRQAPLYLAFRAIPAPAPSQLFIYTELHLWPRSGFLEFQTLQRATCERGHREQPASHSDQHAIGTSALQELLFLLLDRPAGVLGENGDPCTSQQREWHFTH